MKYTFTLVLLFTFGLSQSQTTVFFDEFKDNSNKWSEGKTAYKKRLVNAGREMYLMKSKGNAPEITYIEWIPIDFDSKRNFKITARLYKEGGRTDYGYGIVWGGVEDNYFIYQVNANGDYHIGKKVKGEWENISDGWISNSNIEQGRKGFNELSVRKKANQYTYSINGVDVATAPFENFYGNKTGFVIHERQKIMIDWLKIEYLN